MVKFSRKERKIIGDISSLSKRLAEDRLYEIVAEEIDKGDYDSVAKLKALEEAKGDERLAKANYARHRVRRLMDLAAEYAITQAERANEEAERKAEQEMTGKLPQWVGYLAIAAVLFAAVVAYMTKPQ